ncbi:PREDICTED: uncharacterized protein LOC102866482 [Elephantulus edwardii]|uniref:uncharacterized protein LOC102866482 n=1 Tax=Elephantulus edwardii TaxID=28737 RepID=UPI0003F0EA47|nr:PREDICTED: uncharacterized protein LOC102866482 [Elephantulus edwardii]
MEGGQVVLGLRASGSYLPPYFLPPMPPHSFLCTHVPSCYPRVYNIHSRDVTRYPANSIVVVGGCPVCRVGVLEDSFTFLGIFLAIILFPFGFICCFSSTLSIARALSPLRGPGVAGALTCGSGAPGRPPAPHGQPCTWAPPCSPGFGAPGSSVLPGSSSCFLRTGLPTHHPRVYNIHSRDVTRVGVLEDSFTFLGIFLAIILFPFGFICCFALRKRRCPNCGATFS